MKKPRILFCPADSAHQNQYNLLERSLRKFHSEEELPLIRVDNKTNDPLFWHRKTPVTAIKLAEEYEVVIGVDADEIIVGDISSLWKEGDWDVKTVLNDPNYPIGVWDISQATGRPYFNGGLIVLKEGKFLNHFHRLCMTDHIQRYQYQEQDILNVLCSDYYDYNVWCMDLGDKIYGEFAKPLWTKAKMVDGKVMIDDKQLCIIHFGGGFAAEKGNYRIRFQPDVVKYIDGLLQ